MKLIKVSPKSYISISLTGITKRQYDDYPRNVFVLRKVPTEKLNISKYDGRINVPTVERVDGIEYCVFLSEEVKHKLKCKVPVNCKIVLIRKSYLTDDRQKKDKRGIAWL